MSGDNTPPRISFLTKGYEPTYGARPIKRLMQKELVNLLAKAILDGHVHRDSAITVTILNGQI
ncbi:MAG: hypothetical protein II364_03675, partial [Bacteroidales bacterium]|nr:hypothetical protein [Bacteroidales bacterium]